jgi:hypothetical protein
MRRYCCIMGVCSSKVGFAVTAVLSMGPPATARGNWRAAAGSRSVDGRAVFLVSANAAYNNS